MIGNLVFARLGIHQNLYLIKAVLPIEMNEKIGALFEDAIPNTVDFSFIKKMRIVSREIVIERRVIFDKVGLLEDSYASKFSS